MGFDKIVPMANATTAILIFLGAIGLRCLSILVYNVYFHPLHKFPGPKFAGASSLYNFVYTFIGQKHVNVERLHNKYGEVVRIAPNQLSFICETAWKDIYAYRGKDRLQMQKGDGRGPRQPPYNIVNAPDEVHAQQRKILSSSFSDRALREQEALMLHHINLLVTILQTYAEQRKPVDIVKYFEFTTSDIISDFCFGESYGQLKSNEQKPEIKTMHKFLQLEAKLRSLTRSLRLVIILRILGITQLKMLARAENQVKRRLETVADQKDMMKHVIGHMSEDGDGMSMAELSRNAMVLMLAGSETTATTLSGSMFYLLQNPDVLDKLTEEVRDAFQSNDDITVIKVAQLPYLNAVIEETLRIYSPVPVALTRIVPPDGAAISGYWVPGNTTVGIPHRAAFRSTRNFVDPLSFTPERWLMKKDEKFNNDNDLIFQPFSAGPRNCLGKNMAYAEMRLILARLLVQFDFELVEKESKWDEQQAFILYQKPPLMLHVKARS